MRKKKITHTESFSQSSKFGYLSFYYKCWWNSLGLRFNLWPLPPDIPPALSIRPNKICYACCTDIKWFCYGPHTRNEMDTWATHTHTRPLKTDVSVEMREYQRHMLLSERDKCLWKLSCREAFAWPLLWQVWLNLSLTGFDLVHLCDCPWPWFRVWSRGGHGVITLRDC